VDRVVQASSLPDAARQQGKGPARMPGAGAVNIAGATIAGVDRVAGHEPVVVVPAGALPPGASPTSVAPWVMLPASKGHVRSANATARRRGNLKLVQRRAGVSGPSLSDARH